MMVSLPKSNLLTVLDIGTSKVCCAVGRFQGDQGNSPKIRLISLGYQASQGVKKGRIVQFEALEESILGAIHVAEQNCGETLKQVYVGIPSSCVNLHRIYQETDITSPVADDDIKRLLSLHMSLFSNQTILHVFPLSYTLDGIDGIKDPRGMIGKRLRADLNVLTVPSSYIQNLTHLIGRCHLDVQSFVISAYVSSLATLVEDEMEMGATLIEIGAGCTSLASFYGGNLVNLCNVPIAGSTITGDIARCLGIPYAQAERLKTLYGSLITSSRDDHEDVVISPIGDYKQSNDTLHHIPKSSITQIIRARVEEILDLSIELLEQQKVDPVVLQRIVLTGGSAQLPGFREMIQNLWGTQSRIAAPHTIITNNELLHTPAFSAIGGLLYYACQDYTGHQWHHAFSIVQPFWSKVNHWMQSLRHKR